MQPGVWIAIYLPLFVLFFVILPSQRKQMMLAKKRRRKRGISNMSNELLKRYVGKICNISAGAYGSSFNKVKIIELVDNWVKVEAKGMESLINTDYIQSIKILS